MHSRYVERDAEAMGDRYARQGVAPDVALRVYTTRLLGQDPALVLHGGGNTSVKTVVADLAGQDTEVLSVKGTGWDMGSMEPAGTPAARRAPPPCSPGGHAGTPRTKKWCPSSAPI